MLYMSAIDYGALLRVNGKFINKNDDLFSYCSDTGYVCDKATYYSDYEKKEIEIDIMGNYYVYAIPIDLELDMKKAAKAVGEKSVEMIHVKDINSVTGYIRGGCTPIGMKKHYKTVFHSTIKNYPEIIISGGRIGAQIIIAPDDLIKAANADVCDIVKD